MSDEPVPEVQPDLEDSEEPSSDNRKRPKRSYSEADKYIALAAVDLNGGNVYRTSQALDIPYATLAGWVDDRINGRLPGSIIQGVKERRGDMASKLESLIHSAIESAPAKLAKATFSQTMVGVGIGIDKLRLLRGQGLEPDPATELCKLLGINRTELPERLELGPGEELPSGFGFAGPVIDVEPEPAQLSQEIFTYTCNSCDYTVNVPAYLNAEDPNHGPFPCESCHRGSIALTANPAHLINHQPGCDLKIPCSCGAHQALLDNAAKSTEDGSPTPGAEATDGDAELLNSIDDDDSAN